MLLALATPSLVLRCKQQRQDLVLVLCKQTCRLMLPRNNEGSWNANGYSVSSQVHGLSNTILLPTATFNLHLEHTLAAAVPVLAKQLTLICMMAQNEEECTGVFQACTASTER